MRASVSPCTVEENKAQAVVWYQKAADLGDAAANYEIARRYLTGEGVEKNAAQGRPVQVDHRFTLG
jgi:TPR repeat protein